jgi:predicted AlkP superfamily phosphohydrolase/phosphomutase
MEMVWMAKKVMIVGWDSAPPDHVFDKWLDDMPNLRALVRGGAYGPIRSTDPPITCPAWQAMATSKNPGHLGCYGFRNRYPGKYVDFYVANSQTIRVDTMYTLMSRKRKKLILLGVPQTYPPKPLNGLLVCSFLAPGTDSDYTYPSKLKDEIKEVVGEYIIDVRKFRTDDKDWLLGEIYKMTDTRFELAKHFLRTKEWDFFQMVEMGPDRIQHGFWKFYDTESAKYEPGNPYEDAIPKYYQHLDRQLGELVGMVDRNETAIIVVSDHGAKRMDGAICINDWLIREGYLKLKSSPEPGTTVNITKADVDWENTIAWAFGGYYGRLFMNVKGREEHGVIDPADYEKVRTELKQRIEAITDHNGKPLHNSALRPQDIYTGKYVDEAPDLILYFGDLYWRVSQDVGHDAVWSFETEIGPDDSTHAEEGMFVIAGAGLAGGRKLEGISLYDVAPTILKLMDVPIPDDMEGKPMV